MSFAEIIYRAGELWTTHNLRHSHKNIGRHVQRLSPEKFSFCTSPLSRLPRLSWSYPASNRKAGCRQPDNLTASRLAGFARSESWHHAPDTGKTWPHRFFGDIPYRLGNPYGDIRLVWEPARLQQMVALALSAQDEDCPAHCAIDLIESLLSSWIGSNPPLIGVHYISAMECALRLIAVCHAMDMVRNRLVRADQSWRALLQIVISHAYLIVRRQSLYSSRGNHTIAEGVGLLYAGILFPEYEEAAKWKTVGLAVLEQEAARQVLNDGGGVEQALWYQLFNVDLLGLVRALIENDGNRAPTSIVDAITRGRHFLSAFGDGHTLPSVGDCDNGYALSDRLRISWNDASLVPCSMRTFSDSGYTIMQCDTPQSFRVMLDHGPLGMPPAYGHGHADALSVILSVGGHEVLLDTGTYTYNGDQDWRRYFRGTRAHNTVVVDSLDQAVQETTFMWSEPYHAELIHKEESDDGSVFLVARHDGYVKRIGVTPWLAIVHIPPGFWLVWDHLTGQGEHQLELNWHLGLQPSVTAQGYVLKAGQWPLSVAITGGETKLHCGKTNPIIGWRSERYGAKKPISTIQTDYAGKLPHEFVTRIAIETQEPSAGSIFHWPATARRYVEETKTR